MFQTMSYSGTLEQQYETLNKQLLALLQGEDDCIANLANASSLLASFLTDINWCGFYLVKNNELVLGPFIGLPACTRIPYGRGVCGTAWSTNSVQRIDDVHQFPGHIACDARSKSEIVIPLVKNAEVIAVLDIDSPILSRFSKEEGILLQQFAAIVQSKL
ncbi:MAG: GAF domain-containing protein [Bacilli bacterium]